METVTKVFEVTYPEKALKGFAHQEAPSYIDENLVKYGLKQAMSSWANESREQIQVKEL